MRNILCLIKLIKPKLPDTYSRNEITKSVIGDVIITSFRSSRVLMGNK